MKAKQPPAARRNVFRFYTCCLLLTLPLALHAQSPVSSGTVITLAGNGSTGFSGDGGPATNASLKYPYGLTVGRDGTLYLADVGNNRIRALNPTNGLITTIASTGTDGDYRGGIAVDRQRNALYLSGYASRYVFKVNPATGGITAFAGVGPIDPYPVGAGYGDGHPATEAWFDLPIGIAVGSANNVFIADLGRSNIRKVNGATGIISTIAGIEDAPGVPNSDHSGDGGPAVSAGLALPYSLAADRAGNIFILEADGGRVRRIDGATGIITTVAGGGTMTTYNGPATNMNLIDSRAIAVSDSGDLFIAYPNQVFKVDLTTGLLTVFAGTGVAGFSGDGGPALNARFWDIWGLAVAPGGGLLISDQVNERIRYIAPASINLTNDSGQTAFYLPWVGALAGDLMIASTPNVKIVSLGSLTTVSGNLLISDNPAASVINLGALTTASGNLLISDNTAATTVNLGSLTTASGNLVISKNTMATVMSIGSLTTINGDVIVSDNTSANTINVGSLGSVTGSVSIENNTAVGSLNLSALTNIGGSISVGGNNSVGSIDLGSLLSVGSVSITNNTSAATLNVGSLGSVTGSVSIENNTAVGSVDLGSLTNSGSINVNGNTTAGSVDLGALISVTGSISISNNTSASSIDLASLSGINGDLTIVSNNPNAVVNLSSLTNVAGTNAMALTLDGTIGVTNGLTLGTNATLAGSSTLDGSVTNNGTISPGSSPGRINITGNLALANPSRLRLELGGYAPGQFDFINVAGSATLGGTLSVSLINNFKTVMTNGASLTVLTAGSPFTGAFANVASGGSLTTTDGYARFTVRYAGENTLRLTDLVIVDTDSDGLPDWWEDQFGLSKTNAADAALDTDGDGASNANEFLAGTKPNDPASLFRLLAPQREGGDLRLIWTTVGGKSYRVQTNGSLGDLFADFSALITVPGVGESITNLVDVGVLTNSSARNYRVRLGP